MARGKRRSFRRRRGTMKTHHKKPKIPILPILGVGVGVFNGITGGLSQAPYSWLGPESLNTSPANRLISALNGVSENFLAFDATPGGGGFNTKGLSKGWGPVIVGVIGHVVASKSGLNKYIGRFGVVL